MRLWDGLAARRRGLKMWSRTPSMLTISAPTLSARHTLSVAISTVLNDCRRYASASSSDILYSRIAMPATSVSTSDSDSSMDSVVSQDDRYGRRLATSTSHVAADESACLARYGATVVRKRAHQRRSSTA